MEERTWWRKSTLMEVRFYCRCSRTTSTLGNNSKSAQLPTNRDDQPESQSSLTSHTISIQTAHHTEPLSRRTHSNGFPPFFTLLTSPIIIFLSLVYTTLTLVITRLSAAIRPSSPVLDIISHLYLWPVHHHVIIPHFVFH